MRNMIKFSIPLNEGNELLKSGKIGQRFQSLTQDFKPEAAYFYPENGQRSGFMIIDVDDEPNMIKIAESFWFALHADVSIIPVVNAEDLAKGTSGISAIVKRYA